MFMVSGKEITAWNRKEGCFNINAKPHELQMRESR
jgi:hypothetical protein